MDDALPPLRLAPAAPARHSSARGISEGIRRARADSRFPALPGSLFRSLRLFPKRVPARLLSTVSESSTPDSTTTVDSATPKRSCFRADRAIHAHVTSAGPCLRTRLRRRLVLVSDRAVQGLTLPEYFFLTHSALLIPTLPLDESPTGRRAKRQASPRTAPKCVRSLECRLSRVPSFGYFSLVKLQRSFVVKGSDPRRSVAEKPAYFKDSRSTFQYVCGTRMTGLAPCT